MRSAWEGGRERETGYIISFFLLLVRVKRGFLLGGNLNHITTTLAVTACCYRGRRRVLAETFTAFVRFLLLCGSLSLFLFGYPVIHSFVDSYDYLFYCRLIQLNKL